MNIAIKLCFLQKNKKPKNLRELLRNRAFSIPTIWLFAVGIYLILGFVFDLWHPGWIVFLLAVIPTILL
jgi:fatty acid desaturase